MSRELENARGEGYFKQISQKLDMLLKSFDSDKNTQLRWVWELIQNAKDTPNDFNKVKIRQQLTDECFKSSHNGNAFKIPELNSMVAQYSTKVQQNNQNRKTTGKYGTGFVTTLIVSREVTINGYVTVDRDYKQEHQKKGVSSEILTPNRFYYKKFEMPLDRSYDDRDVEFKRKVRASDNLLTDIVQDAEKQHKKLLQIPLPQIANKKSEFLDHFNYIQNRTVDSMLTVFTYPIRDGQKIQIIQTAIKYAYDLIPYALLFNQNFSSYDYINSNKPLGKNGSFAFQRKSLQKISKKKNFKNIHLFTYFEKSQYCHQSKTFKNIKQKHLIASISQKGQIYAAIPISKNEDVWKIQKVPLCQIFKDFPLIGSQKIGWNAIINSDNFYPDQKRSSLLLGSANTLNPKIVNSNKRELLNCFEGVKQLYIFLARQHCDEGLENLLLVQDNISFAESFPDIRENLCLYIKQIMSEKFIPSGLQGKKICSPNQLTFISAECSFDYIESKHKNSKICQRQVGKKINDTFRCFFDGENLLASDQYVKFYDTIQNHVRNHPYYKQNKVVQLVSFEDCVKKVQNLSYVEFQKKFKKNSFKKLHQIYTLITTLKLPAQNFKIYLNQDKEFKSLKQHKLMIHNISPAVQQLLDVLEIPINNFIIHTEFSQIFKKISNPKFEVNIAADIIVKKFEMIGDKSFPLKLLFRLLLTLNQLDHKMLPAKTIKMIKNFNQFKNLQRLQLTHRIDNLKEIKKLTQQFLLKSFAHQFKKFFENLLKNHKDIQKLAIHALAINQFHPSIQFFIDLHKDHLLGKVLCEMDTKLSFFSQFIDKSQLRKLNKGVEYPNDKDIQIFQILECDKWNIRDPTRLVVHYYPQEALDHINQTSYANIFGNVLQKFKLLRPDLKKKVLSYAENIRKQFMNGTTVTPTATEKYECFKNLIAQRGSLILEIKSKQFLAEPVQAFLYEFLSNEDTFHQIVQNFGKRNSISLAIGQQYSEIGLKGTKKPKKQ